MCSVSQQTVDCPVLYKEFERLSAENKAVSAKIEAKMCSDISNICTIPVFLISSKHSA